MRKKHNFNIFPLNFEKITDFQFSMAAKRVRVPPFFFNIQMEMGMEHSHCNNPGSIVDCTVRNIDYS